ncbi:MAG: hypothetical protein JO052_10900 [Bradyrhizobium sp.]|nr:hypothetical protein [Bradyrhizobium sp.]
MGKPQSGEPANRFSSEVRTASREENASNKPARRPTRRSIVDLTEAAHRAADDGVLPAVVTVAPNQPLITAGKAVASDCADDSTDVSRSSWPGSSRPSTSSPTAQKQDVDARHKAGHDELMEAVDQANRSEPVARLAACNKPDASAEEGHPELPHPAASGSCELSASDSSADMAVKIAKAYQAETLDDIKAGFNAALDYAAEFSRRGASSEAAKVPADRGHDRRNALAAQYRAGAVELMQANMATTMDFARRLLGAKSSAEWVELTSTQARLQCELMLQQAQALRSLARGMTDSDAGQAGRRGRKND